MPIEDSIGIVVPRGKVISMLHDYAGVPIFLPSIQHPCERLEDPCFLMHHSITQRKPPFHS